MGVYQFRKEQILKESPEKLWNFISDPTNLKRITPEYMGFDITSESLPEKMHPGLIITYRVSPLMGIKTTWVTEITHIEEGKFFVDEQRVGPYKLWHHQHHLSSVDGGTLMIDIVTYSPPFGFFGKLANRLFIRKKLNEIFEFRRSALEEIFNE